MTRTGGIPPVSGNSQNIPNLFCQPEIPFIMEDYNNLMNKKRKKKDHSDSIVHVRVYPTRLYHLSFELSGVHRSEYVIDLGAV